MGWAIPKIGAVVALAAALAGCATPGAMPATTVGAIPTAPLSILPPPVAALSAAPTQPMPADTADTAVTPSGYVSFCLRFADQCQTTPGAPATIALTQDVWRTLAKVNSAVNDAIWPEDDSRHYGRAEYWTIPTDGYGDCEDYALTKRKALMALGFSGAALRIAVVVTAAETRHAVLTVVTDKGDYVLDNLSSDVMPWANTGFTWVERQDPANAVGWVSLHPADRMLAAAGANTVTGTTH